MWSAFYQLHLHCAITDVCQAHETGTILSDQITQTADLMAFRPVLFKVSSFPYFVIVLCLLASRVVALDFFKVEVPVQSQSREARVAAAEIGLMEVLVRTSGTEDVRANGTLIAQSSRAINFVEQFQYKELSDPALEEEGFQSSLELRFSQSSVRGLLREANAKFWPINRPTVLVWLVEDSVEYGKQFIGFDQVNELVRGLESGANYRGLPLSFPLLDFQDQIAITPDQLWNLDEEAIRAASQRYTVPIILVGKVTSTSSGQTWSNWELFHDDKYDVFDLRSESLLDLGKAAVNPVADYLANRYARDLSSSVSGYVYMQINNVKNFADYNALRSALTSLESVRHLALDRIESQTVNLRVQTDANTDQFISLLGLDSQFKMNLGIDQDNLPAWERVPLGGEANPLLYTWSR